MKFDIKKKIDLSYLGDDWTDCWLEFRLITFGEIKELMGKRITADEIENNPQKNIEATNQTLKILEDNFINGFAISNGKRTEVKKEDIKDLPIEVLVSCFKLISGEIPPK